MLRRFEVTVEVHLVNCIALGHRYYAMADKVDLPEPHSGQRGVLSNLRVIQ